VLYALGVGKHSGLQGPPMWWRIHRVLQYIGVVLMIGAIVAIFIKSGLMTQEYLAGTYSKVCVNARVSPCHAPSVTINAAVATCRESTKLSASFLLL